MDGRKSRTLELRELGGWRTMREEWMEGRLARSSLGRSADFPFKGWPVFLSGVGLSVTRGWRGQRLTEDDGRLPH